MANDMFAPLPFGENDINPEPIIETLDSVSTVSDDLTGRILDVIGDSLQDISAVEADLTARTLDPAGRVLGQTNDLQNELFQAIGNNVAARLGAAGELADTLTETARQRGALSDLPFETLLEISGEAISAGDPTGTEAIAVGGIEPRPEGAEVMPGEEIAVGGIEPEPPGTPPEVPPTIAVPPPTTIPTDQQEPPPDEQPPRPRPRPTEQPPQPIVVQQPPPIVIPVGGGQVCPAPSPTVVNVPPCPEPPEELPPEEQEEADDARGGTGTVPSMGEFSQCQIDTYTEENASNAAGFKFLDPDRLLASIVFGNETVDAAIRRAQGNQRRNLLRPFRWLYWRTAETIDNWIKWFDGTYASMTKSICQINPVVGFYIGMGVMLNLLSYVGGNSLRKWLTPIDYRADRLCPQQIPDENEAVEAFVRGTITEENMKDWVQANDHCWTPFQRLVWARMNRVEPLMALQMFRRGFIGKQRYDEQIRKNGYDENDLVDAWEKLGDFIPPITDLVRFMVRDVEDKGIVEEFGLDDEFTEKWAGEARRWGEQQGIAEDTAKRYWRAHWRIPSPTQLFEMFHRTRFLPDGHPDKVTQNMVETALKQDDLLPFWIKPMINITFRRLSRVDARRAFETGAIDEAFLRNEFVKLGYEDEAVDALVNWAKINRVRVLSNRPEMKLFRDGVITEVEARRTFADTKISTETIDKAIDLVKLQAKKRFQTRCIAGIRKRFLTGDLTDASAMTELLDAGVPTVIAEDAIKSFKCEAKAKGKQPSTSQLCQWLEEGTITIEDMMIRLQRIGWTADDASNIVFNCRRKISERAAREAERIAKQEQAALDKQKREQQASQRRSERQRANAAKQLEKAQRAQRNREKLLQRTVARFAKESGLEVPTADACVRGILSSLASGTNLTIDERIQTVTVAVERLKPASCEQLQQLSAQLADILLEFGILEEAQILALL